MRLKGKIATILNKDCKEKGHISCNGGEHVRTPSMFCLQVSPEVTHQVKVMEKEALMDTGVVQLAQVDREE